jgi:hypothetical protein
MKSLPVKTPPVQPVRAGWVRLALLTALASGWPWAVSGAPLTGRVVDEQGQGRLARVLIRGPENRESVEGHTDYQGNFSFEAPAGELLVTATSGPEWSIARVTAQAGQTVTLSLRRLIDLRARGYYAADLHMHSTHSDGKQSPAEIALACQAAGLQVAALTDHDTITHHEPWLQTATPDFLPLRGQEITTKAGHILGINLTRLVSKDVSRGVDDITRIFRELHEQQALAVVAHPNAPTMSYQYPEVRLYDGLEILNGSIPPYGPIFDFAQGRKAWHHLLNEGLKVAAVGNSDNHDTLSGMPRRLLHDPDAAAKSDWRLGAVARMVDFETVLAPWGWKGIHVGTYRTCLQLNGPPTPESVAEAVRAGRGFVTNGPLALLTLDGAVPGNEVTPGQREAVQLAGDLVANLPLERLEIIVNGEVAHTVQPVSVSLDMAVPVKPGDWVAVEVYGPWPEFATTNAWYIR